jgi:hypothetical protein
MICHRLSEQILFLLQPETFFLKDPTCARPRPPIEIETEKTMGEPSHAHPHPAMDVEGAHQLAGGSGSSLAWRSALRPRSVLRLHLPTPSTTGERCAPSHRLLRSDPFGRQRAGAAVVGDQGRRKPTLGLWEWQLPPEFLQRLWEASSRWGIN